MNRSPRHSLKPRDAVVLLAALCGAWGVGCARSPMVPPPASISAVPRVVTPQAVVPVAPPPTIVGPSAVSPPVTTPLLKVPSQQNPWKPTVAERDWKYIVLHHTASKTGSVESIHASHLQRKDKSGKPWLGIGYHFVIGNGSGMGDGEIEPTFRWKQQMHGAHAGGGDPAYNQSGIGIVLVGNFEEQSPTAAQVVAVKRLVRTLKAAYRISSQKVVGHRDVRATECPGKNFPMAEMAGNDFDYSLSDSELGPVDPLRLASQKGNSTP